MGPLVFFFFGFFLALQRLARLAKCPAAAFVSARRAPSKETLAGFFGWLLAGLAWLLAGFLAGFLAGLAWLLAGFLAGLVWLLVLAGLVWLLAGFLAGLVWLLAGFLAGLVWLLAGLVWLLAGFLAGLAWLRFFIPVFLARLAETQLLGILQAYLGVIILQPHAGTQRFRL